MNPSEAFHLSDITTQLPAYITEQATVLVTHQFSLAFFKELQEKLGTNYSLQYADIPADAKHLDTFNVIIDTLKPAYTLADVTSYAPFLTKGGILITATHNESLLQGKHQSLPFLKNSERKLHDLNIKILFSEASGKLSTLNGFGFESSINKLVRTFGRYIPNSTLYSPYKIVFYKFNSTEPFVPYKSTHTFANRLKRVQERVQYKIRNHKINDSLIKIEDFWLDASKQVKSALHIHARNFRNKIAPAIPITHSPEGKKHLVIAMTYLQIGGVERVMLNLIKGLDRNKFTISLLTTVPSHNEWHTQFEHLVDAIIHVPSIIDRNWPEKYRTNYVQEYIVRNKADVLFITNSTSAYQALPVVKTLLPEVSVYDLLHTHGTPQDNDAYLKISMPFDTYITKRIVIDEYLKTYYTANYPVSADKILVIYNSLDKETLNFDHKERLKDELLDAIPSHKTVITFVGRLESDKSPLRLVAIAKRLNEDSIDASVLVIGDGTLKKPMTQQAEQASILNDTIHFYGASHSPLPLMARSDFTLLVSNAEGIPMSVLESMSVHTPPIASAVGGVPEIIDNAKDGFLVNISTSQTEEEKIELFVSAIKQAVSLNEKQRTALGLAARKKVLDKFSKMSEIYEDLFLENGTISHSPQDTKKAIL